MTEECPKCKEIASRAQAWSREMDKILKSAKKLQDQGFSVGQTFDLVRRVDFSDHAIMSFLEEIQ